MNAISTYLSSIAPTGYPMNISVTTFKNIIALNWDPPKNESRNGRIVGYTVYWDFHGTNVTFPEHRLRNLNPFTEYKIAISAFTLAGLGPKSPFIYVQTREDGK